MSSKWTRSLNCPKYKLPWAFFSVVIEYYKLCFSFEKWLDFTYYFYENLPLLCVFITIFWKTTFTGVLYYTLIRFSLFKFWGRRVCAYNPPPPISGEDTFILICTISTSKNLLSAQVLTIPTISHIQWYFLLVTHWLHLWICIYVHVPCGSQTTLSCNRKIILLCCRVKF